MVWFTAGVSRWVCISVRSLHGPKLVATGARLVVCAHHLLCARLSILMAVRIICWASLPAVSCRSARGGVAGSAGRVVPARFLCCLSRVVFPRFCVVVRRRCPLPSRRPCHYQSLSRSCRHCEVAFQEGVVVQQNLVSHFRNDVVLPLVVQLHWEFRRHVACCPSLLRGHLRRGPVSRVPSANSRGRRERPTPGGAGRDR